MAVCMTIPTRYHGDIENLLQTNVILDICTKVKRMKR